MVKLGLTYHAGILSMPLKTSNPFTKKKTNKKKQACGHDDWSPQTQQLDNVFLFLVPDHLIYK